MNIFFKIYSIVNCSIKTDDIEYVIDSLKKYFIYKNFSSSTFIGHGMDKKCYLYNDYVYKILLCNDIELIKLINDSVFLNLFFKSRYDINLAYVSKINSKYYYVVLKLKYVKFHYISELEVENFFNNLGLSLVDKKILYSTKYKLNSFDYSYSIDFNPFKIIDLLDFKKYNFIEFKDKYLKYLTKKKDKNNYSKILLTNIASTNIILYEDSFFIYDLNVNFL